MKHLEHEYKKKSNSLDLKFENRKTELELEFQNKEFDIEYKYKSKIRSLEKENNHLKKVIDKFKETTTKFIKWICKKFKLPSGDKLIRNFEKETHTFIDAEKQIRREEQEKRFDLEL